MNDRRDQYICAALTRQPYNPNVTAEETAKCVVRLADALLAAAGEKEDPATHEDCISVAVHNAVLDHLQDVHEVLKRRAESSESKLAACEREMDEARSIVKSSQETTMAQEVRRRKDATEIAALKRMREQLTEDEAAEFAWRWELRPRSTVELVKEADRIRSRRQP